MAQVRLVDVAKPRPAPGNATSPPWSAGNCECGSPTSSPPMARRVTDASPAPGWRTTKRARYALKSLPCSGRCGLGGPPRPCRPRFKWNKANEARWRRQGEGGHQAVRYNPTQHDGRWLCMRCGFHYVRTLLRPPCQAATKAIADALVGGPLTKRCSGAPAVFFCTKRCSGAPACQAATKAIADALVGGPLTRRKVHAFAKHPSGSRPGAPGARLPSDRLVLDPSVPKPPGPAAPQVQAEAPAESGRGPQEEDPHAGHLSASA